VWTVEPDVKRSGPPVSSDERDLFFTSLEQRFDELRDGEVAWAEVEADRALEAPSASDAGRSD
jgi:hypothetical protein